MKKGIVGALLLMTCGAILPAPLVDNFELSNEKENITYLWSDDLVPTGPVANLEIGNVFLDPTKKNYVVDGLVFDALDRGNVDEFLGKGGTLIVKDRFTNYDKLARKVESKVAPFDFSNDEDYFGFFVVRNRNENLVYNVNLGYLSLGDNDIPDDVTTDGIPVESVAESIVEDVEDYGFVAEPADISTDLAVKADLSSASGPTIVAYGFAYTTLFIEHTGEKAASYSIAMNVYDIAELYEFASGNVRGVYDLYTSYTISTQSNFWPTKFRGRSTNYNTIVDSAKLKSQDATLIHMGGTIPFSYYTVAGNLANAYEFGNFADYQNITNEAGTDSHRYWTSNVTTQQKGTSYTMNTGIRFINTNNNYNTAVYSRMESFEIAQMVLFIFVQKYYMGTQYRKELKLLFNDRGYFTQEIIVG